MKAIQADNITYRYTSDTVAIQQLSISIQKGEYVAIIGQNGSGKSTFARSINALLLPQEGNVYVMGLDTKDEKQTITIRRHAGMIFQNPDNQIVASLVEEDVAFGPENIGIEPAEIRRRVDSALNTVDMTAYAQRAPYMLSGGQKQRVAIAGVLALSPDIIIFDESTSMLDPQGRDSILEVMEQLNQNGITILHITHSMEEAAKAKRLLVLDAGNIVLDGTPREIFSHHLQQLEQYNMETPAIVALSKALQEQGLNIPICMSAEELVGVLCPSS